VRALPIVYKAFARPRAQIVSVQNDTELPRLERGDGFLEPAHYAFIFLAHGCGQTIAELVKELADVCKIEFPIVGLHSKQIPQRFWS